MHTSCMVGHKTNSLFQQQASPREAPVQPQNIDVGLMLKLQNKVKSLEKERGQLRAKLESMEEKSKEEGSFSESAFNTLKVRCTSSICTRYLVLVC